jgi:uroporphyrin-III C-methyltransferase
VIVATMAFVVGMCIGSINTRLPSFLFLLRRLLRKRKSLGPRMILVGAGPGDPDLLTIAAVRALQEADLVLADRLVHEDVLRLVEGDLRVAPQKKHGNMESSQAQLDAWGLQGLQDGKTVVRLKIGDPFVFGRGSEEAAYFIENGFKVEIISGISSALCGSSAAGIPVTHRGVAHEVLITAGQQTKE